MPPMPPPRHRRFVLLRRSATIASVVIIRPAIDAAFCSAVRVTLVGSRMPGFDHVAVFAVGGVVAERCPLPSATLVEPTTDGSSPALATISRSGASIARRAIWMPWFWSSLSPLRPAIAPWRGSARRRRPGRCLPRPPRGWRAGRRRRAPSFLHLDFGRAPTLITATPPASLATRSCSFSRS